LSCQPMIGNADYPQELYLARGAEQVGAPHVDETAEVRWVPLDEAQAMIASGDILGAITMIGVQHALLPRPVMVTMFSLAPATAPANGSSSLGYSCRASSVWR